VTVTELDTNELNRRGLRPTDDGRVEARDKETQAWKKLSTEELAELKQDLDDFTGEERSEQELYSCLEELLAALEDDGADLEEAKDWVVEFADWTTNEDENKEAEDEELLDLLDGPFKVLRDDTFADPDRLLVWDRQAEPVVQALTFEEATERYQCGGARSQWSPEDLQTLREVKRECFRETLGSYAKLKEDPSHDGLCSTPVLVVSPNPLRPHRWLEVKACLDQSTVA